MSYGFVFYWLAQFVNYSVLVVAAAAILPVLFYVYMRRVYEVTGILPSAALAGVLAVYLANGQDPFLFALALTFAGLVVDACGRRLVAAVLIGVASFANPVAVAVGAIFSGAQYLARPARRPGLRRLALYLVPFLVARLMLTLFFWEAATYAYGGYEVLLYVVVRRRRCRPRPDVKRPPAHAPRRSCLSPSPWSPSRPPSCRPTPWAARSAASSSSSVCRCFLTVRRVALPRARDRRRGRRRHRASSSCRPATS